MTIDDANELPDSWHCYDEHGGWPGTRRKNPWQPAAAQSEMCPGILQILQNATDVSKEW